MNLKIKDNLFIIGNRVISYSTEVAKINLTKGEIVANGTYSRTTGKQLSFLSGLSGLTLVRSREPKSFYQYEYGVKCKAAPFKIAKISEKGTQAIISKIRKTKDFKVAAILSFPELGKRDIAYLKNELGWTESPLDEIDPMIRLLAEAW